MTISTPQDTSLTLTTDFTRQTTGRQTAWWDWWLQQSNHSSQ